MKLNQFICNNCGHKFYSDAVTSNCDCCGQYLNLRSKKPAEDGEVHLEESIKT